MPFAPFSSAEPLIQWSPRIGDPSWIGWATVVSYLGGAVACFAAGRRQQASMVWNAIGWIYLFLAVNKQLDLQSLLAEVGRLLVRSYDLQHFKSGIQIGFVLAVAIGSLILLTALFYHLSAAGPGSSVAVSGCALTLAWVTLRAASFHHVDLLLSVNVGPLSANGVLENFGILISLAGSLINRSSARTTRQKGPIAG